MNLAGGVPLPVMTTSDHQGDLSDPKIRVASSVGLNVIIKNESGKSS